MKIFINGNTGEVIGTVDGFDDDLIAPVKVTPGNVDPHDIIEEVIGLGHPKEELARRLMDPTDDLSTHLLKHGPDGVEEMAPKEKKVVEAKLDKQKKDAQDLRDQLANQPSPIEVLQAQIDDLKKKVK